MRINKRGAKGEEKKTCLVFKEPKTEESRRSVSIPIACLDALDMYSHVSLDFQRQETAKRNTVLKGKR